MTNFTIRRWNVDTHKENDINSDDLGKKDFQGNLRTKIWTRNMENKKQSGSTKWTSPRILWLKIKVRRLEWLKHVIRMEDRYTRNDAQYLTGRQAWSWKTQVEMVRWRSGCHENCRCTRLETTSWGRGGGRMLILREAKAELKGPWSWRRKKKSALHCSVTSDEIE
jgi:hypothetical protein